jgi:hypothetical protein
MRVKLTMVSFGVSRHTSLGVPDQLNVYSQILRQPDIGCW